ncbi:hypothetical protein ECZU36_17270 [Escherichia coli]|nr:hypothetical protein ECZU36_17270 [Escherichia coli]
MSGSALKNILQKNARRFQKTVYRREKDKRVQINVKISPSAKSALDRLTRARKTTQQAILEQLILNGRLD